MTWKGRIHGVSSWNQRGVFASTCHYLQFHWNWKFLYDFILRFWDQPSIILWHLFYWFNEESWLHILFNTDASKKHVKEILWALGQLALSQFCILLKFSGTLNISLILKDIFMYLTLYIKVAFNTMLKINKLIWKKCNLSVYM